MLTLSLTFALIVIFGQGIVVGIRINAALPYDSHVPQYDDSLQDVLELEDSQDKGKPEATPAIGSVLPKPTAGEFKWITECDSSAIGHKCDEAVDGNSSTSWQSEAGSKGHKVFLRENKAGWGDPVAYGTWFEDKTAKWAVFEPTKARFVRLVTTSASKGKQFINVPELDIWAVDSLPISTGEGKWGPTVDFPLVPVGAFIDPLSGNVVSFSSKSHAGKSNEGEKDTTWTAIWNRKDKNVSQKLVQTTKHDIFCPGMAFDVNGSMIVTGGETAANTSTYNATNKHWKALARMNIPRGYQGSTTCADGRIFVIGGSWSPEPSKRGRTGELYDPSINKWVELDNCQSEQIETETDTYPAYRADNHVWLLGWKENTIFHAGPAAAMHWITTAGKGRMVKAGIREPNAAMCGVAAMYDAAAGKILTAGGAPQYEVNYREPPEKRNERNPASKNASSNAVIITLHKTNADVEIESAGGGMHFPRTFLNAVILPNGDTFVAGGQEVGQPFTDATAEFRPGIYSPKAKKWKVMKSNSIPRTYHSFGLLLQDATVLVGGGGLCDCPSDHFDAQIYTPPYLLTSHARPIIKDLSPDKVHLGANLTFIVDSAVTDASLIRYGGATHTVNNDQRRIALKPVKSGTIQYQYDVQIPACAGVAIPGYWMLFVMNEAGVPSVASTVLILCTDCKVMQSKVNS